MASEAEYQSLLVLYYNIIYIVHRLLGDHQPFFQRMSSSQNIAATDTSFICGGK